MLLQMTLFHSFLWLSSIPLYEAWRAVIHGVAKSRTRLSVNQHLDQPKCCSMSWLL